jgi:hypothetical protein
MLSLFALIVSVFGFFVLLFSLRQTYRARLRQFEEKYVERYWSILDDLSLPALRMSDQEPNAGDEKVIRKYLFLCEDELQMRKNGYISDATYEEWADGMRQQLEQPMFERVWEQVQKEGNSREPGAFPYENLRNLLEIQDYKSGKSGDPVKKSAPARMIRGLKGIDGV